MSAYNANKEGDFRAAATYIEQAILVEKAALKEKTWRYRGEIYLNIAGDTAVSAEYPNAMNLSMESLFKARELDKKNRYEDEILAMLDLLKGTASNKGIEYFNLNDFETAGGYFDLAIDIASSFNIVDSVLIYSSALSYKRGEINDKALSRYKECAEIQYNLPNSYLEISMIYQSMGDLESAVNTLREARDKYPEEILYITEEYNIHIQNEDQESALACIIDATNRDSTNYQYIVLSGNIYQNLGLQDEAQKAFEKALKLDNVQFGANYGLGVLHNNKAAIDLEKYNNFPLRLSSAQKKERTALKVSADNNIDLAISYFTAAYAANPKDFDTVRILKELYGKTSQDDKYFEMKEVLESLKE